MFKKFAFAVGLAAACATASAAGVEVIDLATAPAALAPAVPPASTAQANVVVPAEYTVSSELPEPEVFLMMLVGLLLIGVRASHVSHEKFEQ